MHAIGHRLNIEVPRLLSRDRSSAVLLAPDVAAKIAVAFDGMRDQIRRLEKLFIPGTHARSVGLLKVDWDSAEHPRAGGGPNPGWFAAVSEERSSGMASEAGADIAPLPVQDFSDGFHDVVVDDLVKAFTAAGVPAVKAPAIHLIGPDESIAGRPDILIHPPGRPVEVVEVKTGSSPTFTRRQAEYLPMLQVGGHYYSWDGRIIDLGLVPGVPFPPMPVTIVWAPKPGQPYQFIDLPPPTFVH